jgi:hypothetical protein
MTSLPQNVIYYFCWKYLECQEKEMHPEFTNLHQWIKVIHLMGIEELKISPLGENGLLILSFYMTYIESTYDDFCKEFKSKFNKSVIKNNDNTSTSLMGHSKERKIPSIFEFYYHCYLMLKNGIFHLSTKTNREIKRVVFGSNLKFKYKIKIDTRTLYLLSEVGLLK